MRKLLAIGIAFLILVVGDNAIAQRLSPQGGTITGATTGGGLVAASGRLGLLTSCNSSEVLKWNGSAWACAADAGASSVDGTGTPNALARWTDANTLGDSSWNDDGAGNANYGAVDTRVLSLNTDGVVTMRHDDNSLLRSLNIANRGITAAGHGIGINLLLADGGAAAVAGVALDALSENTTYTGGTADASFSIKIAENGTHVERLKITSGGATTLTGSLDVSSTLDAEAQVSINRTGAGPVLAFKQTGQAEWQLWQNTGTDPLLFWNSVAGNSVCSMSTAGVWNCSGGMTESGTAVLSGSIGDGVIPKGSSGNLVASILTESASVVTAAGSINGTGYSAFDTLYAYSGGATPVTVGAGGGLDVNGSVLTVSGGTVGSRSTNGIHFGFASNVGTISATQPGTANRELNIAGHPLRLYGNGALALTISDNDGTFADDLVVTDDTSLAGDVLMNASSGATTIYGNLAAGDADADTHTLRGVTTVKKTGADSAADLYFENDVSNWRVGVDGANSDRFHITETGVGVWMNIAKTTGAVSIANSLIAGDATSDTHSITGTTRHVLADAGTALGAGSWTTGGWTVFGPNAGGNSGGSIGIGYSSTSDEAHIAVVHPSTAWKPLKISASTYALQIQGANGCTLNASSVWSCTGGMQENGTAVLSGSITDNYVPKGSSGNLANSSIYDTGSLLGIGDADGDSTTVRGGFTIQQTAADSTARISLTNDEPSTWNIDNRGSVGNGFFLNSSSGGDVFAIATNGQVYMGDQGFGIGVASNVDVLTIGQTGTGQSSDQKSLLVVSHTGSYTTAGGSLNEYGVKIAMNPTESAGGNTLSAWGIYSSATSGSGNNAVGVAGDASGAGAVNYGSYFIAANGTTGNNAVYASATGTAAYSFYGAAGTLHNAGNVILGDAITDEHTINGYVGLNIAPDSNVGLKIIKPTGATYGLYLSSGYLNVVENANVSGSFSAGDASGDMATIAGGMTMTDSDSDTQITLVNTSTGGRSYIIGAGGNGSAFPNALYIYDNGAGAWRMRISSTGLVSTAEGMTVGDATADVFTVTGTETMGLTTTSDHTINGSLTMNSAENTIDVLITKSAGGTNTANTYGIQYNNNQSYNTTSGNIATYGMYIDLQPQENAGSNNLYNIGVYSKASDGDYNIGAVLDPSLIIGPDTIYSTKPSSLTYWMRIYDGSPGGSGALDSNALLTLENDANVFGNARTTDSNVAGWTFGRASQVRDGGIYYSGSTRDVSIEADGNTTVATFSNAGLTLAASIDLFVVDDAQIDNNVTLGTASSDTLTIKSKVVSQGDKPTLSSCGTSPTIVGGQTAGTITTGTGSPTTCTLTFATAYTTNAPACMFMTRADSNWAYPTSVSTSAVSLAFTAASGLVIDYHCVGILN